MNRQLIFGEVLFDHFPDGSRVLGGAPFNVAWHLQAFGLSPRFISRVGMDAHGQAIVDSMCAWGMAADDLQQDPKHATGSVQIRLVNAEPQYEIVADAAYDFIDAGQLPATMTSGVLYHGSLALRNPVSRAALQTLKSRHTGLLFMDVNLRAPWWQLEPLMAMLQGVDWVKLNEDELHQLCPQQTDLHSAIQWLYTRCQLGTLVVTLGERGAVAYAGQDHWLSVSPPPHLPVIDTVGAGDGFSAILLLGLQLQWPLALTLDRAQSFAGALVGQRGATPTDRQFYSRFIEQWL